MTAFMLLSSIRITEYKTVVTKAKYNKVLINGTLIPDTEKSSVPG